MFQGEPDWEGRSGEDRHWLGNRYKRWGGTRVKKGKSRKDGLGYKKKSDRLREKDWGRLGKSWYDTHDKELETK